MMAEVIRTVDVTPGGWRTLESGWGPAGFTCIFRYPEGATVKARYGAGWWFGRDGQRQRLDGNTRSIVIGLGALAYARVQISVQHPAEVSYTYVTTGP